MRPKQLFTVALKQASSGVVHVKCRCHTSVTRMSHGVCTVTCLLYVCHMDVTCKCHMSVTCVSCDHLWDVWLIGDSDEGIKESHDGGGSHHLGIHQVSKEANLGGRTESISQERRSSKLGRN